MADTVFRRNDVGDLAPELLVDHHHFAFRHELAVHKQIKFVTHQAVQFDHGALAEGEQVADQHLGAAHLKRDVQLDVQQEVQVGADVTPTGCRSTAAHAGHGAATPAAADVHVTATS